MRFCASLPKKRKTSQTKKKAKAGIEPVSLERQDFQILQPDKEVMFRNKLKQRVHECQGTVRTVQIWIRTAEECEHVHKQRDSHKILEYSKIIAAQDLGSWWGEANLRNTKRCFSSLKKKDKKSTPSNCSSICNCSRQILPSFLHNNTLTKRSEKMSRKRKVSKSNPYRKSSIP